MSFSKPILSENVRIWCPKPIKLSESVVWFTMLSFFDFCEVNEKKRFFTFSIDCKFSLNLTLLDFSLVFFGLLDLLALKILCCCAVLTRQNLQFPNKCLSTSCNDLCPGARTPKVLFFCHGPRWLTQMHVQFSSFVFPFMRSSLWSWNQWRTVAFSDY